MFYSQFGEDRILARIFGGKQTGFCIEVGANDGVRGSTSYHFEQRGWDCILVEPNPALCRAIRGTRRAQLFECAASAVAGVATLQVAEGDEGAHAVSGLGDAEAAHRITRFGFTARPVEVPTRPLDSILEEVGILRNIDFITIDVEGHELEVLQGFSLQRWRPAVLILEDNSHGSDETIRRYLEGVGYVPFRRTGVNDWYAPRDDRNLVTFGNRCSWRLGIWKARTVGRIWYSPRLQTLLVRLMRKLRALVWSGNHK